MIETFEGYRIPLIGHLKDLLKQDDHEIERKLSEAGMLYISGTTKVGFENE